MPTSVLRPVCPTNMCLPRLGFSIFQHSLQTNLVMAINLQQIMALFTPVDGFFSQEANAAHNWGAWLDSYGGIMPRWEVLFNITVLRLISFNMDYYFSLDRRSGSPIEVSFNLPQNNIDTPLIHIRRSNSTLQISPNETASQPQPTLKTTISAITLAYAIYAPLYLTGPIITFNDYISQLQIPTGHYRDIPNDQIRHPFPPLPSLHGARPALRLLHRYLESRPQLVRIHSRSTSLLSLLQSARAVAEAPAAVAIFPPLGPDRWH